VGVWGKHEARRGAFSVWEGESGVGSSGRKTGIRGRGAGKRRRLSEPKKKHFRFSISGKKKMSIARTEKRQTPSAKKRKKGRSLSLSR